MTSRFSMSRIAGTLCRTMLFLVGACLVLAFYLPRAAATPVASVQLFNPNGGELWEVGTTQPILWNQSGVTEDLRLEYSTDGGGTWKTIVDATPADGSHIWTVPDDLSYNAYVRITSTVDPTVTDTNDAPFTIYKYKFVDSFAKATPTALKGGEVVTYTVVLYEAVSATVTLNDPLPYTLTYVTDTLSVEPEWKNPAQFIGGQVRWTDLVTNSVPVSIQFGAQVTPTTKTLVIENVAHVSRNGGAPFDLSTTVIVNGSAAHLPIVIKGP